jgi:hypothetical protein
MPYETRVPDVQILKDEAVLHDDDGNVIGVDHSSHIYPRPGTVLEDEDVAAVVKEAYEDGDEHVRGLLKKLTKAQAAKLASQDGDDAEEDSADAGDDSKSDADAKPDSRGRTR